MPCGFRQEAVFMLPYISLCNYVTPEAGPFLPQEHNLSKMCKKPLDYGAYQICIPNIKALCLVVSDKKIFSCFPYISLCKSCDLRACPF